MDKIQINKSRMYGTVDTVLDNHADLTAQVPELVTVHQQFKIGLVAISQNRQVQEADTKGLTKNKSGLRADVIRKVLQFSAGLMGYAISIKDEELKTKAKYTATDLRSSADPVLFDIGTLLRKLAEPIRKELVKYFLDDAAFSEMDRLLTGFKQAIPLRRVAASVSKVSTANISDVFDALDKLLREKMDVLMLSFQFTQPDFYREYKNARSIVDYSGKGKSTETITEKTV